jgi:hypothetical protein
MTIIISNRSLILFNGLVAVIDFSMNTKKVDIHDGKVIRHETKTGDETHSIRGGQQQVLLI